MRDWKMAPVSLWSRMGLGGEGRERGSSSGWKLQLSLKNIKM